MKTTDAHKGTGATHTAANTAPKSAQHPHEPVSRQETQRPAAFLRRQLLSQRAMGWCASTALLTLTLAAGLLLLGFSGWFITASAAAGLWAAGYSSFNYLQPGAFIRFCAIVRTAGRYAERLVAHYVLLQLLADLRQQVLQQYLQSQHKNTLAIDALQRMMSDIDVLDQFPLRFVNPWLAASAVSLLWLGLIAWWLPTHLLAAGLFVAVNLIVLPACAIVWASRYAAIEVWLRAERREQWQQFLQLLIPAVMFDNATMLAGQFQQIEERLLRQQQRILEHQHAISLLQQLSSAILIAWILWQGNSLWTTHNHASNLPLSQEFIRTATTDTLHTTSTQPRDVPAMLAGSPQVEPSNASNKADTTIPSEALRSKHHAEPQSSEIIPVPVGLTENGVIENGITATQQAVALWVAFLLSVFALQEVWTPLQWLPQAFGQTRSAKQRLNALLVSAAPIQSGNTSVSTTATTLIPPATDHADNVVAQSLMPRPLLQLHQLSVGYHQPLAAPIEKMFYPGDVVLLQGASGVGKTTLLHTLSGQQRPRFGTVQTASSLMLVAQQPYIFSMSIAANLRLAKPTASDQELIATLNALGLGGWLAQQAQGLHSQLTAGVAMLSGGEARRFALARCLLQPPAILLLDEPLAGLDASTADQVLTYIASVMHDGVVIISSHQWQEHRMFNQRWTPEWQA
jgi:ABC-type transport system involved in cytochrome bd biosynthesis fused ATPase/permease subunit